MTKGCRVAVGAQREPVADTLPQSNLARQVNDGIGVAETAKMTSELFRSGFYELLRKPVGDVRDTERPIVALAMFEATFFLGKDF